uniref:Uncharacterized protein n=1 Tax=Palpitomonas bilix TaxID=652834 RepID=A0A7S3LX02_9EUKA|mmetsp:Transcript_7478/g.19304  ORF Transcript_7478/g.19304 Transcript_7478/m.19304 type:complete len:142 (+) Transcript_7478:708-1133(+)
MFREAINFPAYAHLNEFWIPYIVVGIFAVFLLLWYPLGIRKPKHLFQQQRVKEVPYSRGLYKPRFFFFLSNTQPVKGIAKYVPEASILADSRQYIQNVGDAKEQTSASIEVGKKGTKESSTPRSIIDDAFVGIGVSLMGDD